MKPLPRRQKTPRALPAPPEETVTLPDGTKAHRYAPDRKHPEGKLVLVRHPDDDHLRKLLNGREDDHKQRLEELHQAHRDAIADYHRRADNCGVPRSKRPI